MNWLGEAETEYDAWLRREHEEWKSEDGLFAATPPHRTANDAQSHSAHAPLSVQMIPLNSITGLLKYPGLTGD